MCARLTDSILIINRPLVDGPSVSLEPYLSQDACGIPVNCRQTITLLA
jgi:hypothetical protein